MKINKYMHFHPKSPILSQNWHVSGVNFKEKSPGLTPFNIHTKPTKNKIKIFVLLSL